MANASVDLLSIACSHLYGRTGKRAATPDLDQWPVEDWHAALLDIPLDERAYADRLGIDRHTEIDRLWAWWSEPEGRATRVGAEAAGYLGFFLLTLISMHRSDRMRYHGEAYENGEIAGETPDALCHKLIADPHVQRAIKHLYAPPPEKDGPAAAVWATIDFATMTFHRHGTTSIIIAVNSVAPAVGRASNYALKCLIYPYLRIPAIVKATKNYQRDYGGMRAVDSPLVSVWASHDSWILMDYVKGLTLADHLRATAEKREEPKSEIVRPVDIKQMRVLGTALLDAMAALATEERHHNDLTPSNIIVQTDNDTTVKIRLIDLGVNFLHTRTLAGAEAGEAGYVAPEVKANGIGGYRADLYSLGMVLIRIAGIPRTTDGTVPDQFYVASVGLARLLEDLLDADPERRLLVSGIDTGLGRFKEIRDLYIREVEVIEASETGKSESRYQRLKNLLPGASAVERQRKIGKVRRRQAKDTDGVIHPVQAHHLRQANGLKNWAIACAWMSWVTMALVLTWWARDLDLFWQAKWVEYANGLLNRSGEQGIPILDDIRAANYPIPDAWGNLPVRIVAATYALAAVRAYMNIFADMTPRSGLRRRGWRGVRTAAASFTIRVLAVYPTVFILLPTLIQRKWWMIFCPLAIIMVATMNSACLWFAHDVNSRARARNFSTVPKGEIMTLGRLVSWQPAAWLYALGVVIIAIFLYTDRLQDEHMYAIGVGFINIGIWTVKNTGSDAPYVRAGLTRAILAAERLDVLEDREERKAKEAAKAPKPRAEEPEPEPVREPAG